MLANDSSDLSSSLLWLLSGDLFVAGCFDCRLNFYSIDDWISLYGRVKQHRTAFPDHEVSRVYRNQSYVVASVVRKS